LSIDEEIRSRLNALERAWNRFDIAAVIAEYDPAFTAVTLSRPWNYAEYMNELRALFSRADRSRLQLVVQRVRPMGDVHALAEGLVHETCRGEEVKAHLTVVYRRSENQWKIIHAHTSHA
jgi:ketosteroid isomerase-like protein